LSRTNNSGKIPVAKKHHRQGTGNFDEIEMDNIVTGFILLEIISGHTADPQRRALAKYSDWIRPENLYGAVGSRRR
jgi:hypothetical protein